jgi:hypothetical protein
LRFLYIHTLKRLWSVADTPYPKKRYRLPTILSQEEVAQLIEAAPTPFYRNHFDDPLPHQPGIAMPNFRRSNLLDSIVPPKPTHATESWDAAFRAHSCSSENKDRVGRGNGQHDDQMK